MILTVCNISGGIIQTKRWSRTPPRERDYFKLGKKVYRTVLVAWRDYNDVVVVAREMNVKSSVLEKVL